MDSKCAAAESVVLFENELDVLARSCLIRVRKRQEWCDVFSRLLRASPVDREEYRIDRVLRALKEVKLLGEQINDFLARPVDVTRLSLVEGEEVIEKDLKASGWADPALLACGCPLQCLRTNRRIRAQSGCFTLHGGKFVPNPNEFAEGNIYANKIGLPTSLHEIDRSLKTVRIVKWFRIPKEKRASIRQTLSRIGITDSSLFPELDYQARYLRDRWTTDSTGEEDD